VTHPSQYATTAAPSEAQFKRKHSRFIGMAFPVADPTEVVERLREIKRLFPDATHHCSAHRLLVDGDVEEHCDDDGEPLNSAGRPMLQVIAGRELLNGRVGAVRYFGCTKLGVGGLIRAYGDAAKAALDAAEVVVRVPQAHLIIQYPHTVTGAVMGVLHRHNVSVDDVAYGERAQARITLPLARREDLVREIVEASAGRAEVLDD